MPQAPPSPNLPLVPPARPLRPAAAQIDLAAIGIALVVDDQGRLTGTITDGDIRRGMLAGLDLDAPTASLLARKRGAAYERPVVAPEAAQTHELIGLMRQRGVRQVPLLDHDGRPVAIATLEALTAPPGRLLAATLPARRGATPLARSFGPLTAVIMAGGKGTRLRPLTEHTPKPMLHVAGRPLLEHTVERLAAAGVRRIAISTNYLAEQITDHFGDGSAFGVEIAYLAETEPLGTAGCLAMLQAAHGTPSGPVLVLNGDILTSVDFRAMRAFHDEHASALTVAVRRHRIAVPYGVAECDGAHIRSLVEKPTYTVLVYAGIYLLEPWALSLIASGRRFDMTELIEATRDASAAPTSATPGNTQLSPNTPNGPVCAFPIREYWLDIGLPDDYERAQREAPTVVTQPAPRVARPRVAS